MWFDWLMTCHIYPFEIYPFSLVGQGMWLSLSKGILIDLLWWQEGSAPSFLRDKGEAWKSGWIGRPWGPAVFPTVLSSVSDSEWIWLCFLVSSFLSIPRVLELFSKQRTGHVKSVTQALLIWKTDEWKGNQTSSSILWTKHILEEASSFVMKGRQWGRG